VFYCVLPPNIFPIVIFVMHHLVPTPESFEIITGNTPVILIMSSVKQTKYSQLLCLRLIFVEGFQQIYNRSLHTLNVLQIMNWPHSNPNS
jgi:hypothetical protein